MTAPKPDLYTLIHKAIRLAQSDFLVHLGSTDAANRVEWDATVKGWKAIKKLLDAHSVHEDTHIHPIIHRIAPDIEARLEADHEALDKQVDAIDRQIDALASETDPEVRRTAATAIYQDFAMFMARYFDHLTREETEALPALFAKVPFDELLAARNRLIGSIPPEEKLEELPWIARSLSTPERMVLMLATHSGAPPAFFAECCRISWPKPSVRWPMRRLQQPLPRKRHDSPQHWAAGPPATFPWKGPKI